MDYEENTTLAMPPEEVPMVTWDELEEMAQSLAEKMVNVVNDANKAFYSDQPGVHFEHLDYLTRCRYTSIAIDVLTGCYAIRKPE